MSKAIIFTGGGGPASLPEDLCQQGDYLIAADSGYDTARKLGVAVNFVIGDFDSTQFAQEALALEHELYPADKDYSDTYLAIEKALRHSDEGYVLVGGGGYRLDHLLQTYSLFSHFGPPLLWFTRYETNVLVSSHREFDNLSPGLTVSLYPAKLDGESTVDAKKLKWPLVSFPMSFSCFSLSNTCIQDSLEVSVNGDPIFVSFPVARNRAKVVR
ncbi:MAG: thiamine diphosphokinase [Spirochaetia bacterium]|jgi:thiamine pyrophosphokinase|nr:thiamine diphosphokinase [Spirochaetia bacterium]